MKKRMFGLILILFSLILTSINAKGITGAVIGTLLSNSLNFIISLCFVLGIILVTSRKGSTVILETKVDVYESGNSYFMTDPRLDFGNKGVVSLDEFRRDIEEGGSDYVELVREDYQISLEGLASSGGLKSDIAKEFLEILNPNYTEEDASLTKEEKRALQLGFRNWNGSIRSIPSGIVKKYGFETETGGKHVKIRQKNHSRYVVAPLSPSDWRGGRNLAGDIVEMVESNRKKDRKH